MPQDSQLLTHDSFPLGVLATGDSRSFHKRYLVSIRQFPSCTPFHSSHGIFLGLRCDLIYTSCVYDSFLCALHLFSAVLSDRTWEAWQLTRVFFHRSVIFPHILHRNDRYGVDLLSVRNPTAL